MHPRIGKRSKYNATEKKPESKAVEFIHQNTKKSITLKQEYLYLEDVKTALNIHHLELHIRLKQWLVEKLKSTQDRQSLVNALEKSADMDRHHLQKTFKINI